MPVELDGLPPGLEAKTRTVLETDEAPPQSILESRRQAGDAASTLEEFLASEGYLAAEVSPELIDSLDTKPRLDVQADERFEVASVKISMATPVSEPLQAKLDTALNTVPVGAPARTTDIEGLDNRLVRTLQDNGHAFAESGGIDVLASRKEKSVEITYALAPGPYVRLGDMTLTDGSASDMDTIRLYRTWTPGDVYVADKIDQLRARLRSSGLFDGIGVAISQTPDSNGLYPVELTLTEAKRRSVGAGVTASTTDGVGADAFWERRDVTGAGDTFRLQGAVATLARDLTATYTRPNIGRYGRTLTAETGVRAEETDAYDLQGVKVGASLSQPFNKNFTLSAGVTLDATRTKELRLRALLEPRELVTLSFPLAATYSTVKQPLDPQSGNKAFLGIEPGMSVGDANAGYTRLLISGSTYKKIADGPFVAALRTEFGAFFGSNGVPADRLFFAGGGGTVRGFDYQSLSPTDSSGAILGGRTLFDTSLELRYRRSEKIGYVLFVDSGAAADSADEVFGDLRTAIGLGFRYYPGFGPVRVDIATPVDRREGESAAQFYISIGQSF
ncbi:MAG: BamA/TamA family outer membrane protein [Alphaproteobacteria bacterium]|nr:BamA/TamA family outer membrane protein [Alphaproteobacteria bacterium]MBU2195104.1 BamA/TamA family outer membrane protein [Alphaproteobacteria bacterium]